MTTLLPTSQPMRAASSMKSPVPRGLVCFLLCVGILLVSIAGAMATNVTVNPSSGNIYAFGAGFDTTSGTVSSMNSNNGVYFAVQRANSIITANNLQAYINMSYTLDGIAGYTRQKIKNITFNPFFCYSSTSTGTFNCSGSANGAATNPANITIINGSTFQLIQAGTFTQTITPALQQNISLKIPFQLENIITADNRTIIAMQTNIAEGLNGQAAFGIDESKLQVEIDNSAPTSVITSTPANKSNVSQGQVIDVKFNITDDYIMVNATGVLIVDVPNGSQFLYNIHLIGGNGTTTNQFQSNYTMIDQLGNYSISAIYFDDVKNLGGTGILKFFNVDTIPPTGAYQGQTPANNSIQSTNSITINVSVIDTQPGVCSVNINGTRMVMTNRTISPGVGQCNFTSLFPDGVSSYVVTLNDSSGNSLTLGTRFITIDTSPPFLTIDYPGNPNGYGNGTIRGTCTDGLPITFGWSYLAPPNHAYINNSLIPASWNINVNGTFSGIQNDTLQFKCSDSVGNVATINRTFFYDVTKPMCLNIITPITVDEDQSYTWNVTCVDDSNLFLLNVSCGNGFNFYVDNINTTSYAFTQSSGPITSTMQCQFATADAHTLQNVKRVLNPFTVHVDTNGVDVPGIENIITIVDPSAISSDVVDSIVTAPNQISDTTDILVTPITLPIKEQPKSEPKNDVYDTSYSISTVVTIFASDRVRFDVSADTTDSTSNMHVYEFIVHGNENLQWVDNAHHHAWFVVDKKYWVDFDLTNDDGSTAWSIIPINETDASVIITTNLAELDFSSVGIINTNLQLQQFFVTPASEVSGLAMFQCPISITGALVLGLFVALAIVLIIMGFWMRSAVVGFFGSLALMICSGTLMGCQISYGLLTLGAGIFFIIVFAYVGRPGRVA